MRRRRLVQHFITGLNWPADVAIDTGGNVFVSSYWDSPFASTAAPAASWASLPASSGVPYVTDGLHYNAPWGVAVAPDGSIYIAESSGYRLIKLNRNGVLQWTVGQPGVNGDDNAHFGSFWAS